MSGIKTDALKEAEMMKLMEELKIKPETGYGETIVRWVNHKITLCSIKLDVKLPGDRSE